MALAPFLDASLAIRIHALAAMAAFALGAVQLLRPKGRSAHRSLGYTWVALMVLVAGSSFFIHEINQWKGLSLIHLLSIQVLLTLPLTVLAARRGDVRRHRNGMVSMYVGALVVAGLFTLAPGRIMNAVVFGP